MGWRPRLSDKTVRKLAELPIYGQRQQCSPGNVVSGSIRFMQIFVGVRWRGGVNWKWGSWKWRFSPHLFTVFRTFYIHGHTTAFRWCDCQWPFASHDLPAICEHLVTVQRSALHGLCDRNSVRLSVTLVDCVHMVWRTMMISSPYGCSGRPSSYEIRAI